MLGWYVEANETEATVYAKITSQDQDVPTGGIEKPIPTASSGYVIVYTPGGETEYIYTAPCLTIVLEKGSLSERYNVSTIIGASAEPGAVMTRNSTDSVALDSQFTANGKTVYYNTMGNGGGLYHEVSPQATGSNPYVPGVAWNMVYSGGEGEEKEVLVGRFAIDLEDAGGVGPGSDWVDPGDYDPDWEEGDPTHTLYVTVTGSLSGRHNDPIEDPSYSYIPSDKDTVKDYGCGGDGGHGGGGGAGASTVVIHKFATNQANSKEVTALARRHGYGSGGGKGGKGGDGCILVYY